MDEFYTFPSRYICDVFGEMRKLHETRNYSMLLSLIEEAQILANRMEAKLHEQKDLKNAHEKIKELKREIKILMKEKEKLNKRKGENNE